MQFKVPQNIDMEDRIIGPLTLAQFFYLLFGGLIIYILFTKLVPLGLSLVFWILALPIGAFTFAMSFLKVQDRPFPTFVVAFIKYLTQPRARVWQHYEAEKPVVATPKKAETKAPTKKSFDSVKVNELASLLDQPTNKPHEQ